MIGIVLLLLVAQPPPTDPYFEIRKNFSVFGEVFDELNRNYVDELAAGTTLRHGIRSMLALTDPYTILLEEGDDAVMDAILHGRYTGVGIEVGARGGKLVIIAPLEGYAAYEAGIRAGDEIETVDGRSVEGLSVEDLHGLLQGDAGTKVVMTVRRTGVSAPLRFELVRQQIELGNVSHTGWIDPAAGIGYIALDRFGMQAAADVRASIATLRGERSLNRLVLDLRNNPGGLLDQAVDLVDLFTVPGQVVVRTEGRSPETHITYRTDEPVFFDGPVVVLQNGGSASASEIVAGALQDLDRAVIVGDRSFGKGLVQVVKPLSYNLQLKITVARYFTPSGRSIQSVRYRHDGGGAESLPDSLRQSFRTANGRLVLEGSGIGPDVYVEESVESALEAALRSQGHLNAFANQYRAEHDGYAETALPDRVWAAFRAYLESRSFDWETDADRHLAALAASLGAATDDARFEPTRRAVEAAKAAEWDRRAAVVRAALHDELLRRYLAPAALADRRLRADPAVRKAVEILLAPGRYAGILSATP